MVQVALAVEQDHRAVTRITRPRVGFKSFDAAQSTLTGIELMHMLRKGQGAGGAEQGLTAAAQGYALPAESPSRQGCLHLLQISNDTLQLGTEIVKRRRQIATDCLQYNLLDGMIRGLGYLLEAFINGIRELDRYGLISHYLVL
jgi:hypothetical protein